MLKYLRIIIAVLSIVAVTLLFVDFTGTAQSLWPWMAKIQFMPALISVNVVALAVILIMTLLLGRVYCSVICPLGIFQDCVNWVAGRFSRRPRFKYEAPHTRVRLVVLTVFALLLALGAAYALLAIIADLIEPYSAYGRIASQIFAPAYNAVARVVSPDDYVLYRVAAVVSVPVLVIAIITLVTIVAFAWRGGRDYCNTICPVGTVLGYLSRYSVLKITIDKDKCIRCGKCARQCKAKCIDAKHHAIDHSRCVACMDCINSCKDGAISYTWRRGSKPQPVGIAPDAPASAGRRAFMTGVGLVAGSVAMESLAKVTDGGLTDLRTKTPVRRGVRVIPAGAQSHRHLDGHCTECQLCIQSCPNHVLRPSTEIDTFMQPVLDYTHGYCDPSCTRCSHICPVGAFHPVDVEEKSSIKVGTAVADISACISAAEGVDCGNCARHCPVGAIMMVPVDEQEPRGRRMPVVNDQACIGCGECEYYCPVGTLADSPHKSSAIHVEGLDVHRMV